MTQQHVILVNERDEPQGTMEKLEAHQKGLLHRAFSVFIFDSEGRMLLQQRAAGKYHGALLWSNACCSHPLPGEEVGDAAVRRLQEELGFTVPVEKILHFTYRAEVENGLVEYEFDHVFAGGFSGPVAPNEAEVADYRYQPVPAIKEALQTTPEQFTAWFRIVFPRIEEWWARQYGTSNDQ